MTSSDIRWYVMAHHSRSPQLVVEALQGQGVTPVVSTDETNYYKLRGQGIRYKGAYENFRRIVKGGMGQAEPWLMMFHDDVSIPPGVTDRIAYVLGHMPRTGPVAFFNPNNGLFHRAAAEGRHIVETYGSYWIPAVALPTSMLPALWAWGDAHISTENYPAEEGYLARYTSRESILARVIVPSMVQHEGLDKSIYKNPRQVGKFVRESVTYDPAFDPTQVDWTTALATPLRSAGRNMDASVLVGFS